MILKPVRSGNKTGLKRLVALVLLGLFAGILLLAGGWHELNDTGGEKVGAIVHLLQRLAGLGDAGPAPSGEGLLEVHFIDVGQGDAALIRTPQGRIILIDGGPAGAGEAVLRYLAERKISRIDLLVGTHPHEDHIGGLTAVLDKLPVDRVVDSGRTHTSLTYERYLTLIEQKKIPFEIARAGNKIALDSTIALQVLHPGPDTESSSLNNSSVVLRLSYGEVEFLFTGDVEKEGEAEMLERGYRSAPSTVLKVAHHGSSSSSTGAFLKAAAPVLAIISAGRDNVYGHPHEETLERLIEAGASIYRTDLQGSIVITTDGSTVTVERSPDDGRAQKEVS